MTARFGCLVLAIAFGAAVPPTALGQVKPGIHVARATDSFGGVNGIGGNVLLKLPVIPIDVLLAGEYFFTGCDDCSLWGGSADVHFNLPIPLLTPYGTAGLVLRHTTVSDVQVRTGGLGLGAGLNLNALVVGAFAEGRYEFMSGGEDQFLIRIGVRF
jgi:hypothetical protein